MHHRNIPFLVILLFVLGACGDDTGETPAAPRFAPAPGTYAGTVDVHLASDSAGTIHYTVDGATPTAESPSGEVVSITATTTLKAVTVAAGGEVSAVAQGTYTIDLPGTVPPALGPWLTLSGEASTSMVVNFTTQTQLRTTVTVTPDGGTARQITEETSALYHHILLADLEPATGYTWTITYDAGRRSPEYRFTTAPARGDQGTLTFAVVGDMQDNGEDQRWADVAAEVAARQPAFVLATGDLSSQSLSGFWHTFFSYGAPLLERIPFQSVPGNHDTPGDASSEDWTLYAAYFAFSPGPHHAFCYADACFVALNSEAPSQFTLDQGAQFTFAAQALDGFADPAWTFATWHIPPYNVGVRHYSQQGEFRDITALFGARVDWVFSGHEHLYQRFKPMQYNGIIAPSGVYGRGVDDGIGYLVIPPAGNAPEDEVLAPDHEKGYYRDRVAWPDLSGGETIVDSQIGFVLVTITGNTITLTAYGMGTLSDPTPAQAVDSITYTRP